MPSKTSHKNHSFSLKIRRSKKATYISMHIFGNHVHTGSMPHTTELLKEFLPTIFYAQCFNEKHIPFQKEVMRTELGHLFEHILLEYLCILKLQKGYTEASFSGQTDWNWDKDPRGLFRIKITAGNDDWDIFPLALRQAKQLFEQIVTTKKEEA